MGEGEHGEVSRSPASLEPLGHRRALQFYSENNELEDVKWKTDKVGLCLRVFWLPCGGYIEGDQEWRQEKS